MREPGSGQVRVAAQARAGGQEPVLALVLALVLAMVRVLALAAAQAQVGVQELVQVAVTVQAWVQEQASVSVSERVPVLDLEREQVGDLAAAALRRSRSLHRRGACRPRQCQPRSPYRDAARRREM